jgi:hypothetical protein
MELQNNESLLGERKILYSRAIETSYDPAEASPATALVEEEPGSGAPVASDEPEVSGNQALRSTDEPPPDISRGMPGATAEKVPVDGDWNLVDQRSGFLKDVAVCFDELTPGADEVIKGETDQEPIDSARITERLHCALSPARRSGLPLRLDLRPPRHKALR